MDTSEEQIGSAVKKTPNNDGPTVTARRWASIKRSWERFLNDHGRWFGARIAENQVVYAFPATIVDHRLTSLFKLGEKSLAAEQAYAELCKLVRAVAIYDNQPLVYRCLQLRIVTPADSLFDEMRLYSWTDEHIRQAKELIGTTGGIAERLVGSAGRLVCSPVYCSARNKLQTQWRSLSVSEQPPFPLCRSHKAAYAIECLKAAEITPQQIAFAQAFDQFCDSWRISGMTSWELPDVDGPKWPEPELSSDEPQSGRLALDTPWHFCPLAEDGLGERVRQEHEEVAKCRDVQDLKHWRTYGHLFQIDYWEDVIRGRYADLPRRRGFVTKLASFVAEIVDLDTERLQKLRKIRSALRSGRLHSLAGKH